MPFSSCATSQTLQRELSLSSSFGAHRLDGLKYVVFSLGNKTYEHYNLIGRQVDVKLTEMVPFLLENVVRVTMTRAWKKIISNGKMECGKAFATAMGIQEGQGGDTADFAVSEVEKVYLGTLLTATALTLSSTLRDPALLTNMVTADLVKAPFPVPTTVLRHYIDTSGLAGHQMLGTFAELAPNPEAEAYMENLNTDKDAAGNDLSVPLTRKTLLLDPLFYIIVSSITRLQPRYYTILSSPELHPSSIHVTCVIFQWQSFVNEKIGTKWVYGVDSNFLLKLKYAANGEAALLVIDDTTANAVPPKYAIEGPHGVYKAETINKVPIHVRRLTFRFLPIPSCLSS
ncbi:hypothetical protein VKT23_019411 [Stygiomarasmius scandens]|uniref:Sulfite reductase [NADPH] flavoprotein alpha-component-like FAD-binding domain-containing protein n=1 Tax=Marasmiellus scandens TaxID=2682957 RepID=A0ABR1IPF6_9AGAR